jgi:regulator of protease activity HflC (stomatin/prohibitin superfamily)
MEANLIITIALAIIGIFILSQIVRIVPQNEAYVIERLGKYSSTLEAGIHILIPFIDRVAYKHSLKEFAIDVPQQQAITKDNVSLGIDGVLYMKIMDPRAASYGVENLHFAVLQLAQTTMRAEIGKLTLDQTFESRENINGEVTRAIDEASNSWGTKVLRYEVKDISPPSTILDEMEKQMSAERERRVAVTTSEGYKTAQINEAEGDKQAKILRAQGDAQAVEIEAAARANAIKTIAESIKDGGEAAVAQQLSEQYIVAFEKLAKEGTVALIPSDGTDISGNIAKAFTAFDTLKNQTVKANKS